MPWRAPSALFRKEITMKTTFSFLLALILAILAVQVSAQQSFNVPGAVDAAGRKVLTFVNKDPPGQRCNNNLQVASEIANVYRLPIQLLPTSLVPPNHPIQTLYAQIPLESRVTVPVPPPPSPPR